MSDHRTTLVPIESWQYASPELIKAGKPLDFGLLCEALIYYDRVLLSINNARELQLLLQWLAAQGALDLFFSLLESESIIFHHCAFGSAPIDKNGVIVIWNFQGEDQIEPGAFERNVLQSAETYRALSRTRDRSRLYRLGRRSYVEHKASEFGTAVEDARSDLLDVRRASLVLQAYTDALYRTVSAGRPPTIRASTRPVRDKPGLTEIDWGVDLDQISSLGGRSLPFTKSLPFSAAAQANRIIWAASLQSCDIYSPSPLSRLVGDKLYESAECTKIHEVITSLEAEVEFPDIRMLVNNGTLTLRDVVSFRSKSIRFRKWLQAEGDRDRNALIAYHREAAKESGLMPGGRTMLQMFGVIGGSAIGGALGTFAGTPAQGALGGALAGSLTFGSDVASRFCQGWRPIAFGEWMSRSIREIRKTHAGDGNS